MKCTQRICGWVVFAAATSPLMVGAQEFGQPAQQQQRAAQQQPAAEAQSPVIATVDGDPITQQEVQASLQAQLQGRQIDPETAQQLQKQVVDTLIDSRLVEQYVLKKGPDVAEQEVDAAVGQLQQQLQAQEVDFDQFLASRGYTQDMLKTRIEGSLAWQKFQQQEVDDEKLHEFFTENQQHFQAENFEQARPQVTNAYVSKLWEDIVNQMKPNAEIRVAGAAAQAAPQLREGAPQPGQPAEAR